AVVATGLAASGLASAARPTDEAGSGAKSTGSSLSAETGGSPGSVSASIADIVSGTAGGMGVRSDDSSPENSARPGCGRATGVGGATSNTRSNESASWGFGQGIAPLLRRASRPADDSPVDRA